MNLFSKILVVLALFATPNIVSAEDAPKLNTLDAFWAEVSRTVGQGDFEGYAKTYHPDAILVSTFTNNSYPIANALAGWKQGFDDTASGKMEAGVEFKFSRNLMGETTAHSTGMFRYWTKDGENSTSQYTHFEALLMKDGGWKMMMEFQKSRGTMEDWNKISE